MTNVELRLPTFEEREPDEPRGRRRLVLVLVLASTVTIGGLLTALYLGTLGYEIRRKNMHEARLKGILVQSPTVYQVTVGLQEKAPLVRVVDTEQALDLAIARWGREKEALILEKAKQWPQLRVYGAGDMMYFIYFDDEDIMRDYVYVNTSD